ncbi:Small conductance calcium-activated potassium channel protein [Melipona quadrifasciata]|uniref:Small conductance calcium-activated potassium channel protein n=1 Tax=Melipona quadrifasciata TaxID=166423 RepID=A0A0M9A5N1_9HYME|nr:Small conductance calcium-activated potassium channel protein [Melipona quadrifasciata]
MVVSKDTLLQIYEISMENRESVKSGHHCCPCQVPPPPVLVTTSPSARIIRQSSQPEASACCCSGCCCPLHTGTAPSAASLRQLREPSDGIAGIAADSLRINGGIRQFRQNHSAIGALWKTGNSVGSVICLFVSNGIENIGTAFLSEASTRRSQTMENARKYRKKSGRKKQADKEKLDAHFLLVIIAFGLLYYDCAAAIANFPWWCKSSSTTMPTTPPPPMATIPGPGSGSGSGSGSQGAQGVVLCPRTLSQVRRSRLRRALTEATAETVNYVKTVGTILPTKP